MVSWFAGRRWANFRVLGSLPDRRDQPKPSAHHWRVGGSLDERVGVGPPPSGLASRVRGAEYGGDGQVALCVLQEE